MVFEGIDSAHLSEVVGEVPAIVMRGISKELPWPGSRCGWIEVLNRDKDENFAASSTRSWRPSGWKSAPRAVPSWPCLASSAILAIPPI